MEIRLANHSDIPGMIHLLKQHLYLILLEE